MRWQHTTARHQQDGQDNRSTGHMRGQHTTARHKRGGKHDRGTRKWRGDVYKTWKRLRRGGLNIGIGVFPQTLIQWCVQGANQAAEEQNQPSLGPMDQDEPGTVDTRTLDSVENAMNLDAENLSRQLWTPLTPTQAQALYGVGFDLLMGASRQQHGSGVRATSSLRDRP